MKIPFKIGTAAAVEHKMALGGFGYQLVRDGRAEGDPIGFLLYFFPRQV